MADEFYQRTKATNVVKQGANVQGPDRSQELNYINNKAQRLSAALSNFNAMGSKIINSVDNSIKAASTEIGKSQAVAGQESTANSFGWGSAEQQDAYNTVKADIELRNMPSQIEKMIQVDKDVTKPLDEMTSEERRGVYQRNRTKWFEENGINKQAYFDKALSMSDDIMNKHLAVLDDRSIKMMQAKAENDIGMAVGAAVKTFQGNPAAIDAEIESKFSTYAISAGSNKIAEQAVMKGILSEVLASPLDTKAVNYLNSPEAKKRFGHTEGFDTVVKQANKYATKAKDAAIKTRRDEDEQGFYINLNGDAFENEEDVKTYLSGSSLDDKTQFQLMEKARRYLKANENSGVFDEAYRAKNRNVINSVKEDELKAGFERHVGAPTNLVLHSMLPEQRSAFNEWMSNSFAVPKWVTDSANEPINNGDVNALDGMMVFKSNLKNDVGVSAVERIFKPEQSAKIDLWARLSADTTLTDKERKLTLENYDEASKPDAYGNMLTATIKRELSGKGNVIGTEIENWVKEGGSNLFGGPDDMQPLFSARDNTAQSYAKDYISHIYTINRLSGMADQEQALEKAKQSFRTRNSWVDFDAAASYVPMEFTAGADDFKDKGMYYLEKSGILTKLATEKNIPVDTLKSQIYLAPATSYNATRKLAVFYKDSSNTEGTETPYSFSANDFKTGTSIFKLKDREEIERLYKTQQADPEYQRTSAKIRSKQAIMRTFGFGMN